MTQTHIHFYTVVTSKYVPFHADIAEWVLNKCALSRPPPSEIMFEIKYLISQHLSGVVETTDLAFRAGMKQ